MKFEVFYSIGEYQDSIIIESETIEEVREITTNELNKRGAEYQYSNLLEN